MKSENADNEIEVGRTYDHMARLVLVAFLLTFICARIIVFLIMSRTIPDLYAYVKGTHIHHLNYGIFLLAGVGAYLLFGRSTARGREVVTILYGIGMGLTFDEFGLWVHLGGGYWQRASWDAVTVVAGLFTLIAFAPSIRKFRPRHWITGAVLTSAVALFLLLLHMSFSYAGKTWGPEIREIESTAPH